MAQRYGHRNPTFSYGGNPPFGQKPRAPGVVTNNIPPPMENRVVTRVEAVVMDAVPVVAPRLNPRPDTWRNSQTADNYSHSTIPRRNEYGRRSSSTSPERIERRLPTVKRHPDNEYGSMTYQPPVSTTALSNGHVSSSPDRTKAENFATKLQQEALKATAAAEVLGSSTIIPGRGSGGGDPLRYSHTTPTPTHHDPERVKELIHKVGNWGLSRQKQKYNNNYDDGEYGSNINNGQTYESTQYNNKGKSRHQPQYYYGGNEQQKQGQQYYEKPHRGYGYVGNSNAGYYDPSPKRSNAINSTQAVNKYNGAFIY